MAEQEFQILTNLAPVREMTVASNAAEILEAVKQITAPYKSLVVTPETRRSAKDDLARLRRLRTRIEEQRKAVDAIFKTPAQQFKTNCVDPILREIDEAINPIDAQVKAQEAAERQERMDALRAFFEANNTGVAAGFAEWEKIAAKHPEWKNKSCSESQAKNAILLEINEIERGIRAISGNGYEERYRAPMLERFKENYNLADATMLYTDIKRQEAEMEARRQKETERARAEAERKLREAEAERQRREIAAETTNALNREFTRAEAESTEAAGSGGEAAAPAPVPNPTVQRKVVEFRVVADPAAAKALGAFLRGNGIRYEILRFQNEGDGDKWTVPAKR